MVSTSAIPTDGRRARRERSRRAVVDALFALIQDGKVPPSAESIAERAGVSVSSVFRNFDGLDDLRREAFDIFRERYAHLLVPLIAADLARSDRIAEHVRGRLELLAVAGPIMQIARQRALDYEPIAERVATNRSLLADQTRAHFSHEVSQLTPAEAANLVAVIDSLTSLESHTVMRAAHGRTDRQIARAWNRSLTAVLDGWPGLTERQAHDTRLAL